MGDPERTESVVAEATPAAEVRPVPIVKSAAKLELGGDEIIQLSIKPSLWFIPVVSLNVVVATIIVALGVAFAMRGGLMPVSGMIFQLLGAIAALRLAVGTLQWASRLYVLTNRRVMRFKGVMNVQLTECRLAKVSGVDLQATWTEWLLRIGSVHIRSADPDAPLCTWRDVGHPHEVKEILVKAVRKAQCKPD